MIHPGERLENPITGEVLVFHRTAAQSNGASVLVETIVRPHGFVAAAHVHPYQTERFEILEGLVGMRIGGDELAAGPGDVAIVPPGTPHRFWNAGEDEARFLCEVQPAFEFESLIETMFTLAAEGKTNGKGMPNPFRLAVIAGRTSTPSGSRSRPPCCSAPRSQWGRRSARRSATARRRHTSGRPPARRIRIRGRNGPTTVATRTTEVRCARRENESPHDNDNEEGTMRVFVAGASGAIGSRLVPQLIDRGHEVIGSATSARSAARVRGLGARPVVLDVLDVSAVRKAILETKPDAIVHQATALTGVRFSRNLDRGFEQTNRLRREGTDALLAAAGAAGVRRFVAQSHANFRYAREGAPVKSEEDPLDTKPVAGAVETRTALNYVDDAVLAADGIALRYGSFYGGADEVLAEPVRKRQFPIVGSGDGVSSFIHLEDAAFATVLALEHEGPAIYNIVDDDPAPVRDWLPVLAEALGAKPPRHLPVWLARLFAGEAGVMAGTEARGASNAKAKRELGWTLRYPSWRQGFAAVYAKPAAATATPGSVPAHGEQVGSSAR